MTQLSADASSIVRREFASLLPAEQNGQIDDVPLADLGIDSLDFFEKLLILEDEFGIRVPISDLDNEVTLSDILSSLESGS